MWIENNADPDQMALTDLDLLGFKKRVLNYEKKHAHRLLIGSKMLRGKLWLAHVIILTRGHLC